jgi:hypothetical protein
MCPLPFVGRVVAIDRQQGDIDELHPLLPDELRADRPEEVGTVLWLERGVKEVGRCLEGGISYHRYCDVSVIDHTKPPRLLLRKRIFGTTPPPAKDSKNTYGTWPYKEIIEFLQSYPETQNANP